MSHETLERKYHTRGWKRRRRREEKKSAVSCIHAKHVLEKASLATRKHKVCEYAKPKLLFNVVEKTSEIQDLFLTYQKSPSQHSSFLRREIDYISWANSSLWLPMMLRVRRQRRLMAFRPGVANFNEIYNYKGGGGCLVAILFRLLGF